MRNEWTDKVNVVYTDIMDESQSDEDEDEEEGESDQDDGKQDIIL